MQNFCVRDIVKATNGTLLCGDINMEVCNVSTDSNNISDKTLFVPIIGERVDAHKFIDSAISNGAVAVLTSEHDEMTGEVPFIRVSNTTMALQEIGKAYGNKMIMPKIGVTGSVGKTTTKEMIACALSAGYRVFKTSGNSNSQIGVPLTLLKIDMEDQIAVIEMGMSMRGEMSRLAELVELDDAVITNIGVSHIEQLKTRDGICDEKFHIEDAVHTEDGVIFINGDDEILKRRKQDLKHRVITFGLNPDNDYYATDIKVKNGGISFHVNIKNKGSYRAEINVLGEHNVRNALVAIAVAYRHGVPIPDAVKALSEYKGVSMRQQISVFNEVTLIDDSYNASPDSMKAGIDVLCSVENKGRKIAVLADMLELGDNSSEYHREVGEYISGKNIDELVLFGTYAENIGKGSDKKYTCFETREDINDYLKNTLKQGDAVLFKGSRGMKLNECVDFLKGGLE